MSELVFLIKPNIKIKNKINRFKKNIKNKFGNQLYLDHFPHITLFTIKVKKKFIINKKIISDFNLLINNFDLIYEGFNYFDNDPITQKKIIYLKIKKNKRLNNLQIRLLNKINIYKKDFKPIKKYNNLNNVQLKNLKNFGYPFVDKIYVPHLTICSLTDHHFNNKYIKKILKTKIYFKDKINEIYIYKIIKGKHFLLKKIKKND